MNKKVIIAACIVGAIIIASVICIKQIESGVVGDVQKFITDNGGSAKSIEYGLFSDKLVLKEINVKGFPLAGSIMKASEVIILKPNGEAFNASATQMPSVANEVTILDYEHSYDFFGIKTVDKNKKVVIKNWKQNLGKLLEQGKKGFTEEFFTAAFDANVDSVTYTDTNTVQTQTLEGIEVKTTNSIKNMVLENLSPQNIGILNLDNYVSNTTYAGKDGMSSNIDKLAWEKISLPSAKSLAYIFENYSLFLSDDLTEEQENELIVNIGELAKMLINTKFIINNVKFSSSLGEDVVNFNLENINYDMAVDSEKHSFLHLKTGVKGLATDMEVLELSQNELEDAKSYLGDKLFVDFDLGIDMDSQKDSGFEVTFGAKNLAHLGGKLNVTLPAELISTLLTYTGKEENIDEKMLQWLGDSSFNSFEFTKEDNGLLPILLAVTAKNSNMTPDAQWNAFAQGIKPVIRDEIPSISEENLDAIYQCIEKPGTIKVTANTTEKTGIIEGAMLLMLSPNSLNFKIACTPGTNIVEAAQSLGNKKP